MDNMSLCDGTYDWVHMAWTRCITGNPSEAGNHLVLYIMVLPREKKAVFFFTDDRHATNFN